MPYWCELLIVAAHGLIIVGMIIVVALAP